jgi:predicted MPP superfamily phosphohydrolase
VNADTDAFPVVIAHLSDLHFGSHDPASAESLLDDVASFHPTVTVVSGDLTQRARHHEFSAAVAFLDRLPAPRLVVLGNHDVPLDLLQRVTAPYRHYREHVRLDLDPVLDADGVRVLGLQSMPRWRWKSGRVSRRQTDSVVSTLDGPEAADGRPRAVRVVALHHPVSPTRAATLVGRARLLSALAEARVDLVLAGHTHRPSLTWLEIPEAEGSWCVLQGVAGSATSTRLRGMPRSWTTYRIDATTITVEERFESGAGWATPGERHFRRPSGIGSPGRSRWDRRLPT